MNELEVKKAIESRVDVTRQDVVLAKAHILENFRPSTSDMLTALLRSLKAEKPEKVVLHPSVPLEPQIAQAAKTIKWRLAFGEAVWGLVGAGILMPTESNLHKIDNSQAWTEVVRGSGGASSGWRFDAHAISVPIQVRLAPSTQNRLPQPLSDPDLYLSDFEIPNLHPEVEEALRQAALCFRHELYLPCLAMLAKASEGAWIETGHSLLRVEPENPGLSGNKRAKIRETLSSQYMSIVKKMDTVAQLYDKKDIFREVGKRSGSDPHHLRAVLNWSNVVRDSRNAVHYGVDPATQNTYEKVAALLLGAVPNIKTLYAIRRAAEETSSGSATPASESG